MKAAIDYAPLGDEALRDPFPIYARLRAEQPVFWHEQMQSWVIARYDDCRTVLRDHEHFGRDRRRVGEAVPETSHNVQSLDPPQQNSLRSLLMNAFRSQDLAAVCEKSRSRVRGLIDAHLDGGPFDWMTEVAAPFALYVTSDLLGVREPGLADYVSISELIARAMDGGLVPDNTEPGEAARGELNALVVRWNAEAPSPGGVLAVAMNASRKSSVDRALIVNTLGTMFNASFGTVYAMAGNALLLLLTYPDVRDALWSGAPIEPAVAEFLRFDGPAQATSRVCVAPTRLDGVSIETGQTVVTLLASANRDEQVFDHADSLRIDRAPNPHLAFGWGAHACLGARFGQAAVAELLHALIATPAQAQLVRAPTRRQTATVRCAADLHIAIRR